MKRYFNSLKQNGNIKPGSDNKLEAAAKRIGTFSSKRNQPETTKLDVYTNKKPSEINNFEILEPPPSH